MNWRILDHTSGSAALIEITTDHGTSVLAAAVDDSPTADCFDLLIGSPLTDDETAELRDEFLAWANVKMARRAKPQCEWPSAAEIIATMEREIAERRSTKESK